MSNPAWHLITGEYPPDSGGVADYTFLLARGLAEAGQTVHVWTAGAGGTQVEASGVTVHRVAGTFDRAGLARLDAELGRTPGPRRLFVQYVPQAFGRRGTNVAFCRWVGRRKQLGDVVWTMFHEVRFEPGWRDPPKLWILGGVNLWMARSILGSSSRGFGSIPGWSRMIERFGMGRTLQWLPIPATIPVTQDTDAVAAIRARLAPSGGTILGSFATFTAWMRDQHRRSSVPLLESRPSCSLLLLGRDSAEFAAELRAENPRIAGRIHGAGRLDPADVSLHLQACDLLSQPYPDGVSSRRTTVMSDLIHARPVVTTTGHLTEPIWAESKAVHLVPAGASESLRLALAEFLDDPAARDLLALRGLALYEARFSLERSIQTLLTCDPEG